MIRIDNLTKTYGKVIANQNVSFRLMMAKLQFYLVQMEQVKQQQLNVLVDYYAIREQS